MYAVVQLSGFQFGVEKGSIIRVPSQSASEGDSVDIPEILLIKEKETIHVGSPMVEGASVKAKVLGSGLQDKVIVYKFKRRTKYRLKAGHRQGYTDLKIVQILAPKE